MGIDIIITIYHSTNSMIRIIIVVIIIVIIMIFVHRLISVCVHACCALTRVSECCMIFIPQAAPYCRTINKNKIFQGAMFAVVALVAI